MTSLEVGVTVGQPGPVPPGQGPRSVPWLVSLTPRDWLQASCSPASLSAEAAGTSTCTSPESWAVSARDSSVEQAGQRKSPRPPPPFRFPVVTLVGGRVC